MSTCHQSTIVFFTRLFLIAVWFHGCANLSRGRFTLEFSSLLDDSRRPFVIHCSTNVTVAMDNEGLYESISRFKDSHGFGGAQTCFFAGWVDADPSGELLQ